MTNNNNNNQYQQRQELADTIAETIFEFPDEVCKSCIDKILTITRIKLSTESRKTN